MTTEPRWIDLHLHSTASDGWLDPVALMAEARRRGLSGVALTDHDTVQGIAAAQPAAEVHGLTFVPGIEFSAEHTPGILHVLGYFIDPTHPALTAACQRMIEGRDHRNAQIVERLADLACPVSMERVRQIAGNEVVGRPHIARAMIEAGHVKTFKQAFTRYLATDAPAYVSRDRLTPTEAIALIRAAGGVAGVAHPAQLRCQTYSELDTLVGRLVDVGLAAIEVHHPDHKPEDTRIAMMLAEKYRLASTGGSDFHGPDEGRRYRVGFAGFKIPHEWLDALRERT